MLVDPRPTMQLDGIEAEASSFMNCPFVESALATFQVGQLTSPLFYS
jgi:hypothetical protein